MLLASKLELLGCTVAFTASLMAPSVAKACSCFGQTRVTQQEEVAINAELVLFDSCGGSEAPTITVDGAPAQLIGTDAGEAYTRAVDPPLAAGQTLVVTYAEDGSEPPDPLTLVVGPEDTTPPSLGAVTVDFFDEDIDISCGGGEFAAGSVTVEIAAALAEDDTRYFLSVFADGELLSETVVPKFADQESVSFTRTYDTTPAEICVEVRAVDAAGNESEPSEDCVEGPAADEDGNAGCSCTADEDGTGWMALPLFGLLLGLRRMRSGRYARRVIDHA